VYSIGIPYCLIPLIDPYIGRRNPKQDIATHFLRVDEVVNSIRGLGEEINESLVAWMILGAKFRSWANFPWFFQKQDSLF